MPNTPIQVPNIANLRRIDSDTVIYVSPSGNDSTGVGTTAAPYQSLGKAMSVAREYTIAGTAVLTVRLLRGEYTLSSNIDLYHPQGANLVIEGDPDAFRQRTVWQVANYTWNLANFAGGGHTANMRLFDGTTTGTTLHGFTGQDQGLYFSVTNGAFGSRSGYATNGYSAGFGVARAVGILGSGSTTSGYSPLVWGDRFFNHGFSYEDGAGILGIGRILGATTHGETLTVQLNNLNWDSRCPAWHTDGGINNTVSWAGVANNYPETQYSQPNGYYGDTAWKSENGSKSFPARGSLLHVTDDPYILSLYPVTIRAPYTNNTGSLVLKGGRLRAIRNIMFANSDMPYTLSGGVTGATLNWTQAITAVNSKDVAGTSHSRWAKNGCALVLEDSEVGIRHLGFLGTGTAVSAFRSKVTKYTASTANAAGSGVTGSVIYATLNSLDNAPVMCVNQCQNGIISKNSTIDFTDSSGTNLLHKTNYSEGSVVISAGRNPVFLSSSQFNCTSAWLENATDLPIFTMKLLVPIFPGTTLAGASASFVRYTDTSTIWTKYPLIKVTMTTSAGVQDIGNVNFYSVESSEILGVAGSTTSATYSGGIPVSYQKYLFTGLKTMANNGGLSYSGDFEVRNGITSGVGGTLGVYFYGDVAGTSLIGGYFLDKVSVSVRTEGGNTASITGIPYADGTQYTSYFLQTYDNLGGENRYDSFVGQVSGRRPTPMPVSFSVTDTSDALVEKVLWIHNCGNGHPVHVGRSSRLLVGDSMVDSIPSVGRGATDADSREGEQTGAVGEAGLLGGANATTGVVCVTGYRGRAAVLVSENSYFKTGVLFAKHPTLGFSNRFRGDAVSNGAHTLQDSVLWVTDKSYAVLGGLVSLGNIVRPEIYGTHAGIAGSGGFYIGRTGIKWGAKDAVQLTNLDGAITSLYDSYIRLVGGVSLDGQTLGYVFHWDGGTGAAAQTSNGTLQRGLCLLSTFWEGVIRLPPGSIQDQAGQTTTAPQYIRYTQDARTSAAQKINTRSAAAGTVGHVYNTSGAPRPWLANTATGVSGAATGFAGLNGQHFSKTTDALTPPTAANIICSINVQGGRIFIG